MNSEYDKKQWQEQSLVRDIENEKVKIKLDKARKRAARKAKTKLSRLHKDLSDLGQITDFEDEFGESVLERLDTFGSAFYDLQKGNMSDALSFAQKRVVLAMTKKVKDLKKPKFKNDRLSCTDRDLKKKYSSFSSVKVKKTYKPNVRDLSEDMPVRETASSETYIPEYSPKRNKPFLRIVNNN